MTRHRAQRIRLAPADELRLAMAAERWIPPWQTEYRFHPRRRWRFDFAFPELMIAVEVEGGTASYGRIGHGRPERYESDCEKYNQAAVHGWLVLRVTTAMVRDGRALETLAQGLRVRRGLPTDV